MDHQNAKQRLWGKYILILKNFLFLILSFSETPLQSGNFGIKKGGSKVLLKSGPQWTPLESLTLNAIATMLRLALNGTAHTCNENSAISVDTCFASPLRFTQRRASARLARTTKKVLLALLTTIKETITNVIVSFIWAAVDSNHRPHPYQGCALTT